MTLPSSRVALNWLAARKREREYVWDHLCPTRCCVHSGGRVVVADEGQRSLRRAAEVGLALEFVARRGTDGVAQVIPACGALLRIAFVLLVVGGNVGAPSAAGVGNGSVDVGGTATPLRTYAVRVWSAEMGRGAIGDGVVGGPGGTG